MTPGPWTRKHGERFQHDQSAGIRGPDGNYVAAALDFNNVERDDEVEANAHAISMVPDLIEAVESLLPLARAYHAHAAELPHADSIANQLGAITREGTIALAQSVLQQARWSPKKPDAGATSYAT